MYVTSHDNRIKTQNNFDWTFIIFAMYTGLSQFISVYEEGQYVLYNDDVKYPDGIIFLEPKPQKLSQKKFITFFRNSLVHNDNPNHDLTKFVSFLPNSCGSLVRKKL